MPRKPTASSKSSPARSRGGRSAERASTKSSGKSAARSSGGRSAGKSTGKTSSSSRARSAGGRTTSSQSTKDHDLIRRWAEERGGSPASVKGTESRNQAAGLLRIDFPGFSGAGKLEPVSWEEFFQKFDEQNLTFLYQDQTRDGKQSRFFKFVCEENLKKPRNPRG